jgi:alkylation response protein AidB-like acyl-CoA dehydrogenase
VPVPPDAQPAIALEQALGDARDPQNPYGWAAAVAADEHEAFPEALIAELTRQGSVRHFVPIAHGGLLTSVTRAAWCVRAAARRDLTAAIALGQCFLGSVPVWIAGSAAQRERQATTLLQGRLACLALTEQAHGSDLLAGEVAHTDGRMSGTKWLINNATRAELLTVLARTTPSGGLGGFTLYQLDKAAQSPAAFTCLPKIPTHGIRGADISGITFHSAAVPESARLGAPGSGIELALKALQVTRIGCSAFSLGAADTALRLALDFARDRQLYGATVLDIPHARAVLTTAFVDLLIAEAVALGALRGLHVAPDQMSLASAVVKYFVPTTLEQMVRNVAVVLGARHYLRDGPFQKVLRDIAVVSLFDGSTAVNLEGIALQLSRLKPDAPPPSPAAERLARRFDPHAALAPFDGQGLELMGPGTDDVLQGPLPDPLANEIGTLTIDRTARRSVHAFETAARAADLYAAASCVHLHRVIGGDWLDAALTRLRDKRLIEAPSLTQQMLALHRDERWFSHFAIPLHS